ncbi:outer membrane lipoprotein Blc [Corynebacterium suranareeae]|uniref:Outer membrane lipoprotein Blc n=1 Tax=Corynebacterium suranareeae TaxID=2506452 RepID=A0A169RR81_9CORY|nr:lipocalin family protein [Corynebacterium suranareeae]BAU95028.1 outer membrane lipoprotein Blc [Corynebacterium suranareeae]
MRILSKFAAAVLLSVVSLSATATAQAQDIFDGGRLTGGSSQVSNLSSVPENLALPEVENSIDLERYKGTWYQVAAIPQPFSLQCSHDVTADYGVIDSDTISVTNKCGTFFGPSVIEGSAKVVSNASLKVNFPGVPFQSEDNQANYRVTYIEDDYSLAIVGSPSRSSGFILSRTPQLSSDQWSHVRTITEDRGWWPCAFITVPATGGLNTATPLCTL